VELVLVLEWVELNKKVDLMIMGGWGWSFMNMLCSWRLAQGMSSS